jgi:hypothetical protein
VCKTEAGVSVTDTDISGLAATSSTEFHTIFQSFGYLGVIPGGEGVWNGQRVKKTSHLYVILRHGIPRVPLPYSLRPWCYFKFVRLHALCVNVIAS